MSTKWSEEVESAKVLTQTVTHNSINFLVDQEKLLNVASTYGKIITESRKSDVDVKPCKTIDYKSKGLPQCVFGTAGTQQGQLSYPSYVAVSPVTNNIVVSDRCNDRIQMFKKGGEFVSQFGSRGKRNGEFLFGIYIYNGGVAVTNTGIIVVADTDNSRLQLFTEGGDHIRTLGSAGSGSGQFKSPRGVAVDKTGLIYVCDSGNKRIQILQQDGSVTLMFDVAVGEGYHYSVGLVVASTGDIIVAGSSVTLYTPKGQHAATQLTKRLEGLNIRKLHHVAVDSDDNIIVSDGNINQIYVFRLNGELMHNFVVSGTHIGQFCRIGGVACTQEGHIIVADSDNKRIQIF